MSLPIIKTIALAPAILLLVSLVYAPLTLGKNAKPVANAGTDQSVTLAVTVNLNGTQSTDTDGKIVKYQWTQTQGSKVKLHNAKTATPSFLAPGKLKKNTTATTLAFKLTVTDNKKAKASDTVSVTVTPQPLCLLPQILKDNVCITPPPSCTYPKILVNNACVLVCKTGQTLQNDVCVDPLPVCSEPQVLKNGECITPPPVCTPPQVLQYNQCITVGSLNKLNDTGMVTCSDGSEGVGSLSGCGNGRYPGQDAEFGRDVYAKDDTDGHAGFSFRKISATGAELPASANEWTCVKDNVTGLMWETKTDDGGLRDKDKSYTYYSPTFNPNNEYGAATDAAGFVNAVNQQGLCGHTDWRIPTTQELLSIDDYSRALPGPAIDQKFFPNTYINNQTIYPFNSHYWTSSPYPGNNKKAWSILFADGSVFDDDRNHPGGVALRLVRGGNKPESQARYSISVDGQEVSDSTTGLIWRRCVEGMVWNGETCMGEAHGYMFEEALQQASSEVNKTGKNWRLPNTKELASLIESDQSGLLLDPVIFPETPNFQSWTSTGYITDGFFSWMVHFYYGWVYFSYTEDTGTARLVRDGGN